jgi:Ca2+-binding RTX toxin-like protein
MPWPGAISPSTGTTPDPLVKTTHYVDPLILDLDGDGLEITPLNKGILFDADGDSIKTGTAWAGADDGLLVFDRNSNEQIDSGAELFGDETILANGQKAANGFAALSDLDKGSVAGGVIVGAGDGVFDAKDAQYANLRIWRDLNQDGVSQANELQTLADAGVQSIKLVSANVTTNYGDAILKQSSTFTRADGSTGQAGSFILAQNNFAREFLPITVSDGAKALPAIKGSGWVRDLQEAATVSPELISYVNDAKIASTRAGYKGAVGQLLREWGNDSSYNNASKQALATGYGLILSDPVDDQESGWMNIAIKASEADRDAFRATLTSTDLAKFDSMRERMVGGLERTYAYEAFTGYTFLKWDQIQNDALHYVPRITFSGHVAVEVSVPLSQILFENRNASLSSQEGYIRVTIPSPASGMLHVETLWNRLVDDATDNLMPTLRLSKYLDMVELSISEIGVALDFSHLNTALTTALASNAREGAALFLDLYRHYGSALNDMGWSGVEQLRSLMQSAVSDLNVRSAFSDTGYAFFSASAVSGTESNDVFVGNESANSFNGGAGNDILNGLAGNDSLSGGAGDDVIFGGDGNDNLYGGDGADTLDGGTGNDYVTGGMGSDTYLFGKGDGQDYIYSTSDTTAGKIDTLLFKSGVAASEITLGASGTSLIIKINGSTDQITVLDFLYQDNVANADNPLQQIKFADGTTWDLAAIQAKLFAGTEAADTLNGTLNADTINGLGGGDHLYGKTGNDTLDGGAGIDVVDGGDGDDIVRGGADNDYMHGDAGNDTLDGGTGNDNLFGGMGSDTYLFGKGDGQDYIYAISDTTAGKIDTLLFKSGVAASEITLGTTLGALGTELIIKINGTTDQITVLGFLHEDNVTNAYNPLQQIKFADGTTWDLAAIQAKLFSGTDNADTINGTLNADTINGLGGNDTLYGRAGNDTLDGGTGNDNVFGGIGSDTYLFGKGDGQDNLYSTSDTTAGKIDTLLFKSGVAASEITLGASGTSLIIKINGTTDQITVRDFLFEYNVVNAYNPLQQIKFADGTTWDLATIQAKLFAGTDDADTINGTLNADTINGLGGDDTLYGKAGNDTLDGGAGVDNVYGGDGDDSVRGGADDDYVYGDAGNDTLDGGVGNDMLSGGAGNDTYLFGKGDGQDTISYDYDTAAGKNNVLKFKTGVAASEVIATCSGSALVLSIAGTADKLTLNYFFDSVNPSNAYNPVQQVQFADGTTWDVNALTAKVFAGTAGNDNITGTLNADTINGANGDDTLYGRDGNDLLSGGDGNDTLNGENGNDTLDGGAGNDQLNGEAGNDTYLFGKGDGQDSISSDYDTAAGKLNVLQFKSGVAPSEIVATRSGSDLVLSIAGTTDKVTIGYFFYSEDPANAFNAIQQVKFADGTTWSLTDIQAKLNVGTAAADSITGTTAADVIDGQAGADTLYGRDGNDTLNGGADNDSLFGENGNDTLDGSTGNDTLSGGVGNDTYLFGKGDGQDSISSDYDTAASKLNVLQFKSGVVPSEIVATRSDWDLVLSIAGTTDKVTIGFFFYSDDPANVYNAIQQVKFADGTSWDVAAIKAKVSGATAAADNITGTVAADVINGLAGADSLFGRDGNDTLNGDADNDTLYGENGNDTLDGGAGNDQLSGGAGNDTYLFGKGDGQDTIDLDYDTAAGKLNVLQFKAGVAPSEIVATRSGTDLVLSIAGTTDKVTIGYFFYNDPANAYNPLQQIKFADGTTWSLADIQAKLNVGTEAADTLNGTLNADIINGLGGADYLYGKAGNDTLDGGAGADNVYGGDGDDTVRGGADNDYLYGDNGADTLDGGAGNDQLSGGAGNDTLNGGTGDDTYVVDNTGDTITENASEGTDTVQSSISYTLGANVENLTLTGTAAIDGTGNSVANVLIGNSADNKLDGKAGADTLTGGVGNDTYFVDNTADSVVEQANEGADTVQSAITYTLGANLEHLTLTGTATINGTGNSSNNTLTGNSAVNTLTGGAGNDTLNGAGGADTLIGGTGNDIYVVDNTGDTITEKASEGTDTVRSAITYTLGANLEHLTLTGTAAINGTGNSSSNTLTGNSAINTLNGGGGNDTLNGAGGADKLIGGTGNDTYVVDNTGDTIAENASEGTDTVQSAITYTLGANLEHLTLTGTAAINGTGNSSSNTLTGNSVANTLNGGAGNDTLIGGLGNDVLTGGTGNDIFRFVGFDQGVDSLSDFVSGSDLIHIVGSNFGLTAGSGVTLLSGTTTPSASGTVAQFLYNKTSGALYFDQDGANTAYSAIQIATLTGQKSLIASDIVVVNM